MKTIYYWQSGVWTDDKGVSELAVLCLGFDTPETVELDNKSDIDAEIARLI